MKVIDLTGQRFGRLVVVSRAENTKRGQARWVCQCDCGNITEVKGGALRSGATKSCGCYQRDRTAQSCITHGGTKSRLYLVWAGMKQRCLNINNSRYAAYGGRGIRICDEWENDFAMFRDWAFANGYDENAPFGACTLDRINNDGDYEPSNCRWIEQKEQARNQRTNVNIGFCEKTQTVTQWAEERGIKTGTLAYRIRKGWEPERALTTTVER